MPRDEVPLANLDVEYAGVGEGGAADGQRVAAMPDADHAFLHREPAVLAGYAE